MLKKATFLLVLDYGDLLYMQASAQCLQRADKVYHSSLRLITNKAPTDHCVSEFRERWSAPATRRLTHWYTFIY